MRSMLQWLMLSLAVIFFVYGCKPEPKASLSDMEMLTKGIKNKFIPDGRVQLYQTDWVERDGRFVLKGMTTNKEAYDGVKHVLDSLGAAVLDSFEFVDTPKIAIVNNSVGNVRSNPKHAAELSTQVLMGYELRVWSKKGSWYKVQGPDGYLGWLDAGAMFFPEQHELKAYRDGEKVMVVAKQSQAYDVVKRSEEVADLVLGDIIVRGDKSGRGTFLLPDGRQVFVDPGDVMPLTQVMTTKNYDLERIIDQAFELKGRPYMWGGTSAKAMDCSGFTRTSFLSQGVLLPRDASQQYKVGMEIEIDDTLSQMKRGDLLFFGRAATADKKEKVTHVAIYLGDGQFIHSAGNVNVLSLNKSDSNYSDYRRKSLIFVRRMIADGALQKGVSPLKIR